MKASSIALSGLQAQSLRLHASAHNVANVLTDDFKSQRIDLQARASGGVQASVGQVDTDGPLRFDLGTGEVAGQHCIMVDDIVDSAGTLCNAADALVAAGARTVAAYVTHGVLSGGSVARVVSSALEELVITDSILATDAVRVAPNVRRISIAPLMGEAIRRISTEQSVSSLFD